MLREVIMVAQQLNIIVSELLDGVNHYVCVDLLRNFESLFLFS